MLHSWNARRPFVRDTGFLHFVGAMFPIAVSTI